MTKNIAAGQTFREVNLFSASDNQLIAPVEVLYLSQDSLLLTVHPSAAADTIAQISALSSSIIIK